MLALLPSEDWKRVSGLELLADWARLQPDNTWAGYERHFAGDAGL